MVKKLTKVSVWVRHKSHIVLLAFGGVMVLLLFFNEDTSISNNMKYQREINGLRDEIKLNYDSAAYYRAKREAVLAGRDELEHLAREKFHMQRPTEDVYLVEE